MGNDQNPNQKIHFQDLTYQDQLNTIWQHGYWLETRQIPGFWLHLYAVDALFVELWICQRQYSVTLLRVLVNTNELEPYLHTIPLTLHELLP